jgi:hypothetical protein
MEVKMKCHKPLIITIKAKNNLKINILCNPCHIITIKTVIKGEIVYKKDLRRLSPSRQEGIREKMMKKANQMAPQGMKIS